MSHLVHICAQESISVLLLTLLTLRESCVVPFLPFVRLIIRLMWAQVKVFLYEMASIGMRSKTAQRYVEAVSLQYKLQPSARTRLQVRVFERS